jgi:F0F1-type ATP synthase assembly protein I
MEQSTFEHVGQQMDDTTHRATRAASAVADAVEDGISAARRIARDGTDAATELLYNTKKHFQRSPFETVALTFVAGIAAGTAIGWMMKREQANQRCE